MKRAIRSIRRRGRDESGLTLIEGVIALAVIATLILPLAGVFYSAASTDAHNREIGDAVAIAEAQLSKADAVTYGDLGYYENQDFGTGPRTCTQPGPPIVPANPGIPSYSPTGQQGVDLGCKPPAGVTPELQFQATPVQVGSVIFSLKTYVVWANGSGSYSQAYKQVYSVVTWNENGLNAKITETVLVYPGGLGAYSGPPGSPGGNTPLPPNVTNLAASVPDAAHGGSTEVDLTWDPAPTPWVLSGGKFQLVYTTTAANLPQAGNNGTDNSWDPSGCCASVSFSGSSTTFSETSLTPSQTYYFEIVAFAADRSSWEVSTTYVSATTLPPPPACSVISVAVSPAGAIVKKPNNYLLLPGLTITVGYSGTCYATDTVTVSATNTTGAQDPGSPYSLTYSSSPTDYTYTLCQPNVGFSSGNHTYTVSLDGIPQSLTTSENFSAQSGGGSTC